MQIVLLTLGKTSQNFVAEGIEYYLNRLKKYGNISIEYINDKKTKKTQSPEKQREIESTLLFNYIQPSDFIILLDEKGQTYTSTGFAGFLQKQFLSAHKRLVFIIGGAYGFYSEIYNRANTKLALSKSTFTHDMARLVFVEQLYRAYTILNNEPYHH